MLYYIAEGKRYLNIPPSKRSYWEFYFVVEGECRPDLDGWDDLPYELNKGWLFHPNTDHGWAYKEPGCKIYAFHFSHVPVCLFFRTMNYKFKYLNIDLTEDNIGLLKKIHDNAAAMYKSPSGLSEISADISLLELSILFATSGSDLSKQEKLNSEKMDQVINWYCENMQKRPTMKRIADEVNISVNHMRTIFKELYGVIPNQYFRELQIEKARELQSDKSMSDDKISSLCGFINSDDMKKALEG